MRWWAGKGKQDTVLLGMHIIEKVGKLWRTKMLHRWFYSEKLRFKRKNNLTESGIVLFSFLFSIGSINLYWVFLNCQDAVLIKDDKIAPNTSQDLPFPDWKAGQWESLPIVGWWWGKQVWIEMQRVNTCIISQGQYFCDLHFHFSQLHLIGGVGGWIPLCKLKIISSHELLGPHPSSYQLLSWCPVLVQDQVSNYTS